MNQKIYVALKIVFSLILLMSLVGIVGSHLGFVPAPAPDMYNTPKAFEFIKILAEIQYINVIMAVVNALALWALWTRREALSAILVLPITVNIVAFHWVIDGGAFTSGALLGNVFWLINLYLLWKHKTKYSQILERQN